MRRSIRAVLTALTAMALVPAAASAAPALDGTFTPTGEPGQIARGPDGNVWFTLTGSSANKEYGKIAPDGTITEYDTTTNGLSLVDVTSGPNGHVWFSYTNGVLEVDPATGTPTEHPILTIAGPRGITMDASGNLWVVDAGTGLVKIGPNGALLDAVPVGGSGGRDIVLGSDGRVWWADFAASSIRATVTSSPYTTENFPLPNGGSPQELAAGPAGQLGFGNPSNQVGRITTGGAISPSPAPGTDAFGVAFGNDGAYWIAQPLKQNVARLTTDGQYTEPITLPAASNPRFIAAGANNTLWVTAKDSKKIHRISGVEAPPQPQPTGTTPAPQPTPPGPTVTPDLVAPLITAGKVNAKTRKLTVTLDEPAALNIVVQQKVKRGKKNIYKRIRPVIKKQGTPGVNTISLGKKFKKGTYRVQVTATDVLGNKTAKPKTVSFKVK